MEVDVTFEEGVPLPRRLEELQRLKSFWDHQSFLGPGRPSTLEILCRDLVEKQAPFVTALRVEESRRLSLRWHREFPKIFSLIYRRPLSVLFEEGGGARLEMLFEFRAEFFPERFVLFERSLLERELELFLTGREALGISFSRNVKENEKNVDALFKEVYKINPLLVSMEGELEKERKWLIKAPFLTR